MGCDIVPLIPDDDHTSCMAYSSFARARIEILEAYFLAKGVSFETESTEDILCTTLGILPEKTINKMKAWLLTSEDAEAPGMLEFLEHSDCEGYYETETCGMIAQGVKIAMEQMDPEEIDDRIESLYETFTYAYEKDGIVAMW